MKQLHVFLCLSTKLSIVLTLFCCCLGSGCGKSSEETPVEAPASTNAEQAAETAQPVAETKDPALDQSIAESEAALKTKDYEKAAVALLQPQVTGKAMTMDQSLVYSSKMRLLQEQLAEAAARGDPKAKAAIELLRSTRPR